MIHEEFAIIIPNKRGAVARQNFVLYHSFASHFEAQNANCMNQILFSTKCAEEGRRGGQRLQNRLSEFIRFGFMRFSSFQFANNSTRQ